MTARFIVADVLDGLATIETGSVDLVVTSPPFLALRSYLPADHPDKGKEIGSESTPAEFIDVMLKVTAELRRVVAPHGSICVELGDTYAGTGGAGGDWSDSEFTTKARVNGGSDAGPIRRDTTVGWPLAKSRTLIPSLYQIALAYGINPLTGTPSPAGQWRVRNVVTWARPNPPVGALGDKWRPATSDLIVACTSGKRYWDDLATRKPHDPATTPRRRLKMNRGAPGYHTGDDESLLRFNAAGAPLLDYWVIPPGGYSGAHYAVFPDELVVPCVQAMCPQKVCRTCGEPSRRITSLNGEVETRLISEAVEAKEAAKIEGTISPQGRVQAPRDRAGSRANTSRAITEGWSDCGHGDGCIPDRTEWVDLPAFYTEDGSLVTNPRRIQQVIPGECHDPSHWRAGLILDPFAGSGTTLAVATGHGHDAIGIDLDERNRDLARDRIGPFLFEEVDLPTIRP